MRRKKTHNKIKKRFFFLFRSGIACLRVSVSKYCDCVLGVKLLLLLFRIVVPVVPVLFVVVCACIVVECVQDRSA